MTLTDDQELAIRNAKLVKLEEPFPEEAIGKLPKGNVMLDYVGHAAVTKRLLQVDPAWSWEPCATTEHGLPLFDASGGLWIRLTICGVTRLGYGDGNDPKVCIGDAIRNAAMRFGVALDLWAKEDLSGIQAHDADSAVSEEGSRHAALASDTAQRPESVDGEAAGSGDPGTGGGGTGVVDGASPPSLLIEEPHEHVAGPRRTSSGKALCVWEDSTGKVCGQPFKPPTIHTAPLGEDELRKDTA